MASSDEIICADGFSKNYSARASDRSARDGGMEKRGGCWLQRSYEA